MFNFLTKTVYKSKFTKHIQLKLSRQAVENQGRRLMTPDDLIGFKGNHIKLSVNNAEIVNIEIPLNIALKENRCV